MHGGFGNHVPAKSMMNYQEQMPKLERLPIENKRQPDADEIMLRQKGHSNSEDKT
jgi:hypothetical protein